MALVSCKTFNEAKDNLQEQIDANEENINRLNNGKQDSLKDCNGAAIPKDTRVPTCEQMGEAIQKAVGGIDIPKVSNATTENRGIVELATADETKEGADNERAVTPAGLKAFVDGLNLLTGDLLGKGLVFNPKTNKWEVNAKDANGVSVNPDGSVGVKLSSAAGNALELRPDGLFYGVYAPDDVRFQYVDAVSGSDENSGSKEAPLRTFAKALSRVKDNTSDNYIYLKERQTHTINSSARKNLNSQLWIRPYGDETDAMKVLWNESASGWDVFGAADYQNIAPTIHVIPDYELPVFGGVASPNIVNISNGAELTVQGFKLSVGSLEKENALPEWSAVFHGGGAFKSYDNHVENTNPNWSLVGQILSDINVVLIRTSFADTGKRAISSSGSGLISVAMVGEGSSTKAGGGMNWKPGVNNGSVSNTFFGGIEPVRAKVILAA